MSDMPAAANSPNSETQLETIGKEVDKFSITVKEPSRKMAHHNAMISLEIPNKLFLLWKNLKDLQQKLGKPQQSSLIHLVNQSIKGKLASVKEVTSVDERIRKLFSTFHSNYTKMGGAKRNKAMSKTTRLLVL